MNARADEGKFMRVYMAHETDEPERNAFPNGLGDIGGGRSRLGLDVEVTFIVLHFSRYV